MNTTGKPYAKSKNLDEVGYNNYLREIDNKYKQAYGQVNKNTGQEKLINKEKYNEFKVFDSKVSPSKFNSAIGLVELRYYSNENINLYKMFHEKVYPSLPSNINKKLYEKLSSKVCDCLDLEPRNAIINLVENLPNQDLTLGITKLDLGIDNYKEFAKRNPKNNDILILGDTWKDVEPTNDISKSNNWHATGYKQNNLLSGDYSTPYSAQCTIPNDTDYNIPIVGGTYSDYNTGEPLISKRQLEMMDLYK